MKSSMILKGLENEVLPFINTVRKYMGEPILESLDYENTQNIVGHCPIGYALARCGYRKVYGTIIDCDDSKNAAKLLARLWKTEAKLMGKQDFCCHRHFDRENPQNWVVPLPEPIKKFNMIYGRETHKREIYE